MKYLRNGLVALLLLVGSVPSSNAQNAPTTGQPADPTVFGNDGGARTSSLPTIIALIYTVAVLSIICMPSRKG